MLSSSSRRLAAVCCCASILLSSTAVSAAPFAHASISPWSALSAMGTQASAASLCSTSSAAAAASAASQAAPGQPGCVLPLVDAAGVPVQTTYATPAPIAGDRSGLGFSPLLLALGALAVVAIVALSHGDGDDDEVPVSPD